MKQLFSPVFFARCPPHEFGLCFDNGWFAVGGETDSTNPLCPAPVQEWLSLEGPEGELYLDEIRIETLM